MLGPANINIKKQNKMVQLLREVISLAVFILLILGSVHLFIKMSTMS